MNSFECSPLRWPLWARAIRRLRSAPDRGVGDTLSRLLRYMGGDVFKRWRADTLRRPCRCAERQAKLNRQFPYVSQGSTQQNPTGRARPR